MKLCTVCGVVTSRAVAAAPARPLMTTAGVLALFNNDAVTSYVPLALPIFLQEMVMGVWLIAKGFRPSAVRSDDLSATRPAITALDDHAPVAA